MGYSVVSFVLLVCVAPATAWIAGGGLRAPQRSVSAARTCATDISMMARVSKKEREAAEKAAAEAAAQAEAEAKAAAEAEAQKSKKGLKKERVPRERTPKAKAAAPAPPAPPTREELLAQARAELEAARAEKAAALAEKEQLLTKQAKAPKAVKAPKEKKPKAAKQPKEKKPAQPLSLPKISLPSVSSGGPAVGPPVEAGLVAGAALGLLPAAALISVRAWIVNKRAKLS
jgi:colicin import membrane protein